MKAERMFRELGFSIIGNYEKLIIYQRKTDFEEVTIWFHKKDWKNIEMRSFWMTFASYPDKIVLYL